MSARRSALSGDDLTLTPFLDIIFATIGIFVLILAVQVVRLTPEVMRPEPDLLAFCTAASPDRLQYAERPDPDAPPGDPVSLEGWEIREFATRIAQSRAGTMTILLAYAGPCLSIRDRFLGSLQDLERQIGAEGEGPLTVARVVQWPLGSDEQAAARLLERWRSGTLAP